MLTIKRPVKILVASHKELRDVDNNNGGEVGKTGDELKVRGWKSWLKKGSKSKRKSFDDDDSDDATDTQDVEIGKYITKK